MLGIGRVRTLTDTRKLKENVSLHNGLNNTFWEAVLVFENVKSEQPIVDKPNLTRAKISADVICGLNRL